MPSLVTLPPEILFNILSFSSPFDPSLAPKHPLYTVAASAKPLCGIVEEYCRGLLKGHANITPPKNPKTGAFVCRRKWIRWISETCQLCGKGSKRRAILDASLTCCQKCDKQHFPKMTMTDAVIKHSLSKLDLFTPNLLHPNLPPLVLGSYVYMGGDTIMLSRPSVLERKAHIHALLGESKAEDTPYLHRRVAAHNRIVRHMEETYIMRGHRVRWIDIGKHSVNANEVRLSKSLRTREARQEYVRKGLEKEWVAMGLDAKGRSKETAIEID